MNQKLILAGMIVLIAVISTIVIPAYFTPVKAQLSGGNGGNGGSNSGGGGCGSCV
jgi:hypothetical protein